MKDSKTNQKPTVKSVPVANPVKSKKTGEDKAKPIPESEKPWPSKKEGKPSGKKRRNNPPKPKK